MKAIKSIKKWWHVMTWPPVENLEVWQFMEYVFPLIPKEHQTNQQCFVEGYRKGRSSMLIWIHVVTVVSVVIGILVGHAAK